MKIKDSSEIKRVETAKPGDSRRAQAPDPSRTADKVTTEARAAVDAAAAAARQALGANRSVRLEAIEAAVRQGSFKPDPQRIAQRILEDAELSAMLQSMLNK